MELTQGQVKIINNASRLMNDCLNQYRETEKKFKEVKEAFDQERENLISMGASPEELKKCTVSSEWLTLFQLLTSQEALYNQSMKNFIELQLHIQKEFVN